MIGLNFQTKSFLNASVFEVYTRIHHRTLVKITNEYVAFQSVIYNATHQYGESIHNGLQSVLFVGTARHSKHHMPLEPSVAKRIPNNAT